MEHMSSNLSFIGKLDILITPIPLQLAIILMRMPSTIFVFKYAVGYQGNTIQPLKKIQIMCKISLKFHKL
jgi:hypothetical protein